MSSIVWSNDVEKPEVQVSLNQLDPHRFRVEANCTGIFQTVPLSSSLNSEINVKFQVCQNCSRQAGGYYESILQIRTKRKEILDLAVDFVYNEIDSSPSEIFTTEEGPVRGGFDFQLSSTEKGRSLARELMIKFGGQVTETSKLIGRKDGRDLLRHTFGVRLPDVKAGDHLFLDDAVWCVMRVDRRKASLKSLTPPLSSRTVEIDSLKNVALLDNLSNVQIVSHRDREYLLLDPFTLQTAEAISPENWKNGKVSAVRYGNDTYFIWD
jgi:nonsense-mediated mRNA decay protein 3